VPFSRFYPHFPSFHHNILWWRHFAFVVRLFYILRIIVSILGSYQDERMKRLNSSYKCSSIINRLSRKNESRIVAALGRGNILLQRGMYLTSEDIEKMRARVNHDK
jgi:hypothetical protein